MPQEVGHQACHFSKMIYEDTFRMYFSIYEGKNEGKFEIY